MCCTFRYWIARWMLQPWLCRAAWHSSVVTPCTVSCTWGGACSHCLLPALGSKKPVTDAEDHRAAPIPGCVFREHYQPGVGIILILRT